jgi:hypothetical protein
VPDDRPHDLVVAIPHRAELGEPDVEARRRAGGTRRVAAARGVTSGVARFGVITSGVARGCDLRAREQPLRDALERLLVHGRALDEEHVQPLVARRGEQQAAGGPAVAPGAAGLLVVGLERPGHALVADRPHVGLVDAHAEGVRGDHDLGLAGHEAPLCGGAGLARHARVVGGHRHRQLAGQAARQPVALRARAGVDDRRPGLGRLERGDDASLGRLLGGARHDREREVRPVEPGGDPHGVA